jgi:hypothetical protein
MEEEKTEKLLKNVEHSLAKTESKLSGEQNMPREWFQTKEER